MNLLIIGGLVVVGLLAIVGAVVLALGDRSAATGGRAAATTPAPTMAPERPAASTTGPLNAASAPTIAPTPAPQTSVARQEVSTRRDDVPYSLSREDTAYPSRREESRLSASNGQFHELAVQLRSLYNEVSDLERRLNALTEIAEHIERRNNERERTLIEDESR